MAGKILITGATGTVGTATVKALVARGADVRVGVRSTEKAQKLGEGVTPVLLDHARPETYAAAFEGVERVLLLTPFQPDQVEIGQRLVDAAKAAGVKHLVKISATGADQEPGIQLGRWHRATEKYVEASGIPWTVLRPASFADNFINYFGGTIKSEGKIYLPFGTGAVSWIDARDIGEVAAVVLTEPIEKHAGKAYELTGPAAVDAHGVAKAIGRAIGKEVTYVDVPEEAAKQGMLQYGAPEWMANAMMELHWICKQGWAGGTTDAVEKLTGRKPIDFETFAKDNAAAWQ